MNMNDGVQVGNLIYATMFSDADEEALQKEIVELNNDNPDWTFELRKQ